MKVYIRVHQSMWSEFNNDSSLSDFIKRITMPRKNVIETFIHSYYDGFSKSLPQSYSDHLLLFILGWLRAQKSIKNIYTAYSFGQKIQVFLIETNQSSFQVFGTNDLLVQQASYIKNSMLNIQLFCLSISSKESFVSIVASFPTYICN